MEIRRLHEGDAEALWTLRLEALESEPQAFRETAIEHSQRSFASFAQQLRDGGDESFVYGASEAGELVGMAGLYRKQPHEGCIWGMYVTAAHRKSGVGAGLIEAILSHVRGIPEIQSVHLTVAHSQIAARNLYLRCGFKAAAEKPTMACGGNIPEDQDNMVLQLFENR